MTRPGWLVRAEHEARDDYERNHWDTPPDRDEPPPERGTFDPDLAARIREGAARMEADRERMRTWGE